MEIKIRTILLLIVMRLSDAEEKKNLTGIEGGDFTLPGALLERGFLYYGGTVIAQVNKRELNIENDTYMNRLHWNKTSGLFTLTDLQRNDSGVYKIESKSGNIFTASYHLSVYEPVAPPAVRTLSVSSDSCFLLCAVDKAAEITLWWDKDQEIVNQSSSAGPLPLSVTKQDFNSSFRCVAGNPAENQTLLVDLQMLCQPTNSKSDNNLRHHWILAVSILGPAVVVAALIALLIKWKCFSKNKTTTTERQGSVASKSEVQYAEVDFSKDRHSQLLQGGNLPDSSATVDRSNLTTVYDKLEAHRMVLPDSDAHV